MFILGVVVYADLNMVARHTPPSTVENIRPVGKDTNTLAEAEIVAEAARLTLRLHNVALPFPLPTPVEEPLGEARLKWLHRLYELSVPREPDIRSLTRPLEELRNDFPSLTVHTEDRPQALEVQLGIAGLRTHTLRFRWLEHPPRAAVVITGLGRDIHLVRQFLALNTPLTFAVNPSEVFADVVKEQLRLAGATTLIQLDVTANASSESEGQVPSLSAEKRPGTHAISLVDLPSTAQAHLSGAAGFLLVAPFEPFSDTSWAKAFDQIAPKPSLILWVNPTTGTVTLCNTRKVAKTPQCRAITDQPPATEPARAGIYDRLLQALARARTTGEAIAVLPGNQDCLAALHQHLPSYAEAGIELTTVLSFVDDGLSQHAQF